MVDWDRTVEDVVTNYKQEFGEPVSAPPEDRTEISNNLIDDFAAARGLSADYCTRENHGTVAALLTVAMAIARLGERWKRSSETE